MRVRYASSTLSLLLALTWVGPSRALDKQGSAHGGDTGEDDGSFGVSGALTFGSAILNPSYAARPDNTGIALFRYAAHADVDLIGRKLSIPLDINVFTDRTRRGALVLSPTELDVIGGLTSTWPVGKDALEVGARVERDMPVDRKGFSQTYVDARARYLYSLADRAPALKHALVDGDVSGAATLGWFAVNPSYAARPDNTGLAFLRYAFRSELSVWHDRYSVAVDTTFFTDRRASVFRPSELDFTYEIILREAPWELHVAYERDMPIDRGGLVQHFVYALLVWGFDMKRAVPKPFLDRGTLVSP